MWPTGPVIVHMEYTYAVPTTFDQNCRFSYWCSSICSRLLVLFGTTVLNDSFIAIIICFLCNLFRHDNSKMDSYHNGMLVNTSADDLFEKLHCVKKCCNYVTIVLIGAIQLVCHYYCIDYRSDLLVNQVCLNELYRSYNRTERTMLNEEHILCNHKDYDDCVIEVSDDDDDDEKKIPVSAQCPSIDIQCSIDRPISFCHKYDIDKKWKSFLINEHEFNKFIDEMGIRTDTLNQFLYNSFKPVITYKNTLDTIDDLDEKKETYYDTHKQNTMDTIKDEDIIAVNETIYTAPVSLPKIGNLKYPILKKGQKIYGKDIHSLHSWLKCEVINVFNSNFALIKFDVYEKLMTTKLIAYLEPSPILFPVGTRVIAELNNTNSTTNNNFCAGFIGEPPKLLNKFRYMIFFDNNCVQYCHHTDIRLIANKANEIPADMHSDDQEFIQNYLAYYPDRKMLKLTQNQFLRAKHKDLWQSAKVLEVDASLVKLFFLDMKESDWVYRGSLRLYKIFERIFPEKVILPTEIVNIELNKQCNENKSAEKKSSFVVSSRNVARKRTNKIPITFGKKNKKHSEYNKSTIVESILRSSDTSTELGEDDKNDNTLLSNNNALRPKKYVVHNCNRSCIDWTSCSSYKTMKINMLAIPLNFGFVRYWATIGCDDYVLYKTPCGRTIRNIQGMYNYLLATESEMTIDYFDFDVSVNPLACYKSPLSFILVLDMSCGKECMPITCVNEINHEEPPSMHYMTTRQPMNGVSMNVESDFLCGCDCTDNCADKSRCACWKMTIIEGQRFLRDCHTNLNIGYKYRRLPEKIFTGIYECNSKCHCSSSCLNRVVQFPISQRLQLFRTEKKGWGVRCLNDIAQGSFICNYVGNLLTEYDANQDGKQFGDEYLAELDYIDTLEKFKEDYEDSIPESDQEIYNTTNNNDESSVISISSDEEFQYIYEDNNNTTISGDPQSSQTHRRCKTVIKKTSNYEKPAHITSRLNTHHNVKKSNDDFPKSLRKYFGNNESVYVMDAKVSGNIGRYLNHSCSPNVFVQNVFVETHDPRFPWLSFFARTNIEAGEELSWDYSYVIGSVPGKILECYCNSDNCKGRLL